MKMGDGEVEKVLMGGADMRLGLGRLTRVVGEGDVDGEIECGVFRGVRAFRDRSVEPDAQERYDDKSVMDRQ
jgi:hypothetical protein